MNNPFKLLKIFGVVFKVIAGVLFVIIGVIGTVGILITKDLPPGMSRWVALPQFLQGVFLFLLLYTLGEIIRLLLVIEEQTRKQP